MRSSIWRASTSALTQFAVTSVMSRASTSSRMARRAERDAERWERSRESGSSTGVDKGVPPEDLLKEWR